MIGRFKYEDEVFYGKVIGDKVVVDRVLFCDTYQLSDLELLPPSQPSKIICVGLNYMDHAKELGMPLPENPIIFLKPPSALIGHLGNIIYPDHATQVDYEAELAIVINKRCRNILAENSEDVIMGYTCFNDVTARDLQKKDTQWTRSKSFDTFAPLGPYIVEPTFDVGNLAIKTRVNGKIRQNSSTSNLIFNIPTIIEFISGIMTLEKGDIISTGTPPGVGELTIGDVVEVEIENIGSLINRVVKQN
jgi:2-keto-4-pentenoate hydratase/2-oxohepta-3-ene-1,7-dioic acid hydratase in catechol pathway